MEMTVAHGALRCLQEPGVSTWAERNVLYETVGEGRGGRVHGVWPRVSIRGRGA